MSTWTLRSPRHRLLPAFVVMALAAVMLSTTLAGTASAHGSVADPASRLYACMYDDDARNTNEMCVAAWERNATALYNWMALLIGDADGQSESIIPDGRLCSAGNDGYAAFDAPGEWPATEVDNTFTVTWDSSPGPHKAVYHSYVTRQGFDPTTDELTWDDLEKVGVNDGFDVEGPESAANSYEVSAPGRSGRHILYTVWQRPDTAEAFYACSDVIFPGDPGAAPADAADEADAEAPTDDDEVPVEDDAPAEEPADDGAVEEPVDDGAADDADAPDDEAPAEDPAGAPEADPVTNPAPSGDAFDVDGIRDFLMSLLTMLMGLFG
jgi:chitin-binding protein